MPMGCRTGARFSAGTKTSLEQTDTPNPISRVKEAVPRRKVGHSLPFTAEAKATKSHSPYTLFQGAEVTAFIFNKL
jgi:hypothetical protein